MEQQVRISAASKSFDGSCCAPLHATGLCSAARNRIVLRCTQQDCALLPATGQDAGVCLHAVQTVLQMLGKLESLTMRLYLNMYVMTLHPGCSSACNFWSSLDMPFGSRYKKTAVAVERSLSKAFPHMMLTLSCKCSAAYQLCMHIVSITLCSTDSVNSLALDDCMLSFCSCFRIYFNSDTLQAYQPRGCSDNPTYTFECKQSSTYCVISEVSCASIQSSYHRCILGQTGYLLRSGWQNRLRLLQHTAAV